jgi:sensor c-di-GMP phosphodiesterase-like protein
LLAAIGIGVVLAGPPVAALNIWLNGAVERQGRAELDLAAQRHMALAEAYIARAVATLEDLAARGIDSCRVANVDALRQTTFATIPVKELSIVATDGRTLCTDVGNQPEQRKVVTSEPLSADSRTMLELVRLGGQSEPWLRLRRPPTGAGNGVAALIPVRMFVAQGSPAGGPSSLHVRMLTAGGTVMAETGETVPGSNGDDSIATDISSSRYAIRATISASPVGLAANQRDLHALGTVVTGLLAIIILTLSVLLPRRRHENPIAEIERAL